MTAEVVAVFLIVYAGMILGGLPFLQLDRTGVALLGAIALISFEAVSLDEAAEAVHLPTIILFFPSWFCLCKCAWRVLWLGNARARHAAPLAAGHARRHDAHCRAALGRLQQRHRLPRDRAGADSRMRGVPARPGAVPACARLCGEHRFSFDL